jgi:hypothetical protein
MKRLRFRADSPISMPLARSIIRRWRSALRRSVARFDASLLWAAIVLLAALTALVLEVSSEAADQLLGSDFAELVSQEWEP